MPKKRRLISTVRMHISYANLVVTMGVRFWLCGSCRDTLLG